MFYFYSGTSPLDVQVPGEQYTITIYPSNRSQKTSSAKLYEYLFSKEFPQTALFKKATSFEPPLEVAPVKAKEEKPSPKAEGGIV